MNEEVYGRMTKSSEDFLRLVWPAIGDGFGRPIPVETVTENVFAKELDTRAGIDVWLICVDGHMRGLASRVQWPKQQRSFDTFSVRVKSRLGGPTEYHKRKAELAKSGTIAPYYSCQAYVSQDRQQLLGAALARTSDVIAAVDGEIGRLMPANYDGTQGWAIPWRDLSDGGVPIRVWHPSTEEAA